MVGQGFKLVDVDIDPQSAVSPLVGVVKALLHIIHTHIAGFYGREKITLVGEVCLDLKSTLGRLLHKRQQKPGDIYPNAGAFIPPHLCLFLSEASDRTKE
jgi:hypothetical protein